MHNFDSCLLDTASDERVAHGIGDGDEAGHASPVLDAAAWHKRDPSRHHERDVPPSYESADGDRVCACVVSVNEISAPRTESSCDFSNSPEVPVSSSTHGGDSEAG